MVVNSWPFWLFFVVVFAVYYLPVAKNNSKFQNLWLFLASYFFYSYVDWKMCGLLLGSTIVFFSLGLLIKRQIERGREGNAAALRTIGVLLGVGILFYFKYLNFFAESIAGLLSSIGFNVTYTTLHIVLPIGVSFFTFKLISYVLEVYRERMEPTKDFIAFGMYIAFFPTMLSGPIDCPKPFLSQLSQRRVIDGDTAADGFRQILWGMMKKMVVADNLAGFVDATWVGGVSSVAIIAAALVYPIQMYIDFSGYSDMAIGVAKILNIHTAKNFNYPFFSTNIAEYWRRWHMSLTNWLTQYIFQPISVNLRDWGKWGLIVAAMVNLFLVGIWHGANWTFAVFGVYHGLLFIPLVLSGAFQKRQKAKFKHKYVPTIDFMTKMVLTYLLVTFGLVIFKAPDMAGCVEYFREMFTNGLQGGMPPVRRISLLIAAILIVVEWFAFVDRDKEYAVQTRTYGWPVACADVLMMVFLFLFSSAENNQFIYFQF